MGAFGSVQRASGKSSLSNELILLATIMTCTAYLHIADIFKNIFRLGLLEIYMYVLSKPVQYRIDGGLMNIIHPADSSCVNSCTFSHTP